MMAQLIMTIGHSTLGVNDFVALLVKHSVTAIADVRSSPYSRFNPQFNRETLKASLARSKISYVFLGAELGARSDDPCCYIDGKVQYELLAKSPLFRTGIARVLEGAMKHRIALMCAEKEPLDCHRTILVARELVAKGCTVQHILTDGSVEPHTQTMDRLLDLLGLPKEDMFRSYETILDEAYSRQGDRIGYVRGMSNQG